MIYYSAYINGKNYYYYSYESKYTKYCKKHNIYTNTIDNIEGYKHISKIINICISTITISNNIVGGDFIISQSTDNL